MKMKQSKITFLTSLGAGLEYYDFVLYVLLASFISQQFFPSTNRVAALFATFGVFAVGNIIRPLGGIIFGIFGDRFGRKKVFANTLLWMAFATFLMGITPTFSTIGLAATVIFSLCRIVQGTTCGAEIPGAVTFLSEHIHEKHHGIHFGFMISAIGLGGAFGSFVIWMITKILSDAQMLAWGFRLPFLLGGVLALVGFFIRKHIPETPAFLAMKESTSKPASLFSKKCIGQILSALGVLIFPACFITFFLALPVYLNDTYHYSFPDIYLAMTFGHFWSATLLPVFGWLSDYVGRKKLLFITVLVFAIFGYSIFSLLQLETRWALFGFVALSQTIIAAMASCYFALLPRVFPTSIRYTATALSYNMAYTIAALFPLVANYIYEVIKKPSYVAGLFISLAILTAISTLTLKDNQDN
ncbi:MAG: MFS type sugar transporter [uncultured bacterium]|nr:MAG: MFS type sugar transporter [uncultured bacterium]